LAGLPGGVIARARELLTELEGTHTGGGEGLGRFGAHRPASEPSLDQLTFFAAGDPPLLKRLQTIDPEAMTPKEALDLLFELHKESRSPEDS
jgi:DNA mismatch repair protein MutS